MSHPTEAKGQGEMYLSWSMIADLLQNQLILPPEFQIVEAREGLSPKGERVVIATVEGKDIPMVKEHQRKPHVVPTYTLFARSDGTRFHVLDHLEIDGKEVYHHDDADQPPLARA
jgi:hypothetical protein